MDTDTTGSYIFDSVYFDKKKMQFKFQFDAQNGHHFSTTRRPQTVSETQE